MATVLVTDGEQRSALAAVRSLGRAGHAVAVCSGSGRSLAGASRHARSDHPLGSAEGDAESWVGELARVARELGADVILPITDASMVALLPHSERLAPAIVPFGDLAAYLALSDKDRVASLAGEAGIALPPQVRIEDAGAFPDPDLGWPVVVKPSRSVVEDDEGGLHRHSVTYARTPADLSRHLRELAPSAYPVLVQRRIVGEGQGVFLLRWKGETLAAFAHRRLREKPPSGGVSVYREAIALDADLVAKCERLLDDVGWRGAAMVEFKVEADSGVPYLMEVNARLWGSLQLAVDAGVDFPRLLVGAALGAPKAQPPTYREGIRSRWWWGDVDHLIARLAGEVRADRGVSGPRRFRALAEFLILWRPGDRYEVLRPSDPRPFLRETRRWIRDVVFGDAEP